MCSNRLCKRWCCGQCNVRGKIPSAGSTIEWLEDLLVVLIVPWRTSVSCGCSLCIADLHGLGVACGTLRARSDGIRRKRADVRIWVTGGCRGFPQKEKWLAWTRGFPSTDYCWSACRRSLHTNEGSPWGYLNLIPVFLAGKSVSLLDTEGKVWFRV